MIELLTEVERLQRDLLDRIRASEAKRAYCTERANAAFARTDPCSGHLMRRRRAESPQAVAARSAHDPVAPAPDAV